MNEQITPTRLFRLADSEADRTIHPKLGFTEVRLAKQAGLSQFGVNHVILPPGTQTSMRHWHEAEDEFALVLEGTPTLVDNHGPRELALGDYVGFPAGEPNGHQLVNRSAAPAVLLVVGSRRPGAETIHYPDDDFGPIRK